MKDVIQGVWPGKMDIPKRSYKEKSLKKYVLTVEQYNDMYLEQEGCCAICGNHESDLVVDHDHSKPLPEGVRGLLCNPCNLGIGHLKDNVESLKKAIDYLEKHL